MSAVSFDTSRILITGGSGMVGSQAWFGIRPSHAELDITDTDSIRAALERHQPSAVVNAAGFVDVHRAETERDAAERGNVVGAANIARACALSQIRLVHLSTCMVFDGSKSEPYIESDTPHPTSVYGDTKHRGEKAVLEACPSALVVRTGWLFGGFEKDTKFIHRFYQALVQNEPIRATSDRRGSPTYVPDLIEAVVSLLQKGESGVAHAVNDGVASYLDVAEKLKEMIGSQSVVTGASSRELDGPGIVRGPMEGLTSERGIRLRSYEDALREYVAALQV